MDMEIVRVKDLVDSKDGLDLLFQYTKFHIGAYLTLTTAYITLATSKVGGVFPKLNPYLAAFAVIFFMLAGLAGGVIISSITQCPCTTVNQLLNIDLGPWSTEWFTGRTWTYIEHTSFWVGLVAAAFSFVFQKKDQARRKQSAQEAVDANPAS
jgi:hypothetical protein